MLTARIDPPEPRRSEEAQRVLNSIEKQKEHIQKLKTLIEEYQQEYNASFQENTLYTGRSQDCLADLVGSLHRELELLQDWMESDIASLNEFGYVM